MFDFSVAEGRLSRREIIHMVFSELETRLVDEHRGNFPSDSAVISRVQLYASISGWSGRKPFVFDRSKPCAVMDRSDLCICQRAD